MCSTSIDITMWDSNSILGVPLCHTYIPCEIHLINRATLVALLVPASNNGKSEPCGCCNENWREHVASERLEHTAWSQAQSLTMKQQTKGPPWSKQKTPIGPSGGNPTRVSNIYQTPTNDGKLVPNLPRLNRLSRPAMAQNRISHPTTTFHQQHPEPYVAG